MKYQYQRRDSDSEKSELGSSDLLSPPGPADTHALSPFHQWSVVKRNTGSKCT
jgi:hypothetical protein